MDVKYIITSRYMDGSAYADKLDTIDEVIATLEHIASSENLDNPPVSNIDPNQLQVTTEEQ